MQFDETQEGVALVRDDGAQLFYPIPEGWQRVPDTGGGSGPTSAIASTLDEYAEEDRKATVYAGTLDEPLKAPGGLAEAALHFAQGLAQLSDARANARFSEESSRELAIDGRAAATASLRADFDSDTGALYLRVTVVDIAEGYTSYLVGTVHPEAADLRAAVDAVHGDLIVALS